MITKKFEVKADCIIECKNLPDLLIKLGKFLWNIGNKKEIQTFEKIIKDGSFIIQTPISNEPEKVIITKDNIQWI